MKATNARFELMLEEVIGLYNAEKEIGRILPILSSGSADDSLNEGIAREAEENREQCARLEGVIAGLRQVCIRDDRQENFLCVFSLMLKRINLKHARFGYHNAIFMAEARGQFAMARKLRDVFLTEPVPVTTNN